MTNDLDLNISNGKFQFDPAEHGEFVSQLERIPLRDKNGFIAYTYQDWAFWVSSNKSSCKFCMRLSHNEKNTSK